MLLNGSVKRVGVGVVQQPPLPQDSTPPPLNVMHRLHEPHQRDVAAETRTKAGRGKKEWSETEGNTLFF